MGEGGPLLKVGPQFLRLWHVHIFARYNYRLLHAIKKGTVPCEAEKEFAFPRFDILMVYTLKAYSIRVADSKSLELRIEHTYTYISTPINIPSL